MQWREGMVTPVKAQRGLFQIHGDVPEAVLLKPRQLLVRPYTTLPHLTRVQNDRRRDAACIILPPLRRRWTRLWLWRS